MVKGSKGKLVLIAIPLMIAFAVLGYITLFSSSYLEVSDLARYDKPVKVSVIGNVTKGSVRLSGGFMEFTITDGKSYVKVVYPGVLQLDNATSYVQVTVEGVYYPDRNVIEASNVLYKCPSKQEFKSTQNQ